jgi:serine/threonine protein kinase
MINHNNEAVLIDFGVSALVEKEEDDTMGTNMGTYIFYAPEMFERSNTNC